MKYSTFFIQTFIDGMTHTFYRLCILTAGVPVPVVSGG